MTHLVITIGCEYGAKGNMIGKKVAEDLGIKFYDRDTVDEIIKAFPFHHRILEVPLRTLVLQDEHHLHPVPARP